MNRFFTSLHLLLWLFSEVTLVSAAEPGTFDANSAELLGGAQNVAAAAAPGGSLVILTQKV